MVATAYVLISVKVGNEKQVYRELEKMECIYQVDAVFGPYDIIAIVQGSDYDNIGNIVVDKIAMIEGIEDTMTCNVLHLES
jgi:DNA-binding Lrp family transcriptional regulator